MKVRRRSILTFQQALLTLFLSSLRMSRPPLHPSIVSKHILLAQIVKTSVRSWESITQMALILRTHAMAHTARQNVLKLTILRLSLAVRPFVRHQQPILSSAI